MDVKYLDDIPNYLPQMKRLGLPRFQYTARCVKTGATFHTFADDLSVTYAELTARRLLERLKRCGVDSSEVPIQTDRGAEFDGNALRKTDRGFTHTIEQRFGPHHHLLLRPNPNADADVGSFHAHEETEFFDIETFHSRRDFWEKTATYHHYRNLARPDSYKKNHTPLEILSEGAPRIPPSVLLLPPTDPAILPLTPGAGHDVP